MSETILSVEHLHVTFETKYGKASAVNDVSFTLDKGKKLGIVGESGSGKSVTVKSIMRLLQTPPAKIGGQIIFANQDLLALSEKEMASYRGNKISMIFQEPMVCLNPLFTIGNQLAEVIMLHDKCAKDVCTERVIEMLRTVGIPSPETRLKQYPFELSGGMRQRVMIAMALLCRPEILVADEPTTALDVTIQAQILELMRELNRTFGTSLILITHDLGVIAETVDDVIVMYSGNIVERATVQDIFKNPMHPYTQGLLKSIPNMEDDFDQRLETIEGNVPSIYNPQPGCPFHNRCLYAKELCTSEVPPLVQMGDHDVRCWKCHEKWQQEV